MNRRIFRVIVAVTTFALILLGVPLALVVRQVSDDKAVVQLEREAARASQELPRRDLLHAQKLRLPKTGSDDRYAVYDRSGRRLAGAGPATADQIVRGALHGDIRDRRTHRQLVAAVPVTANGQAYAAVRAARPLGPIQAGVYRKWLLMAGFGVLVVAIAAAAAQWEARRLSRPVEALAVAVTRLGDGDFTVQPARSGVPEVDQAARAVELTAQRLGQLVERERSFSADASHQLRTPLTGLRLQLENALSAPPGAHSDAVKDALAAVERLEATVSDLLALARESAPERPLVDLAAVVADEASRWRPDVEAADRSFTVEIDDDLPAAPVSPAAVRQILDVLVSNALTHGAGPVTVRLSETPGGLALDVSDCGPGVDGDVERVFQRGEGAGDGHGIGLSLARSLAEAEGGRLFLRAPGPAPRFSLLVPTNSDESAG